MPNLQMTPIYWTPVHDEAVVVRGTWFYQDTMLPVETAVANMLEAGYVDLQVWTETWKDELDSVCHSIYFHSCCSDYLGVHIERPCAIETHPDDAITQHANRDFSNRQ